MSSQPGFDSDSMGLPIRESGSGGASTPTSASAQSQARDHQGSEYGRSNEYGRAEHHDPPSGYYSHDQAQGQAHVHRPPRGSVPYDSVGYSQASMAVYDPPRPPGPIAVGGHLHSRQPNVDPQPASPVMTSYFNPATLQAQQSPQPANYPFSYAHYPSHQPTFDHSPAGYHRMMQTSGDVGGVQSMEAQLHHQIGDGPATPSLHPTAQRQEPRADRNVYYQSPPAQGSGYGPQQNYFGGGVAAPSHSSAYPAMMGGYPLGQYPSYAYSAHQSSQQYSVDPYASLHQPNAAYYPDQRSGWTPQQWRAANVSGYHPHQPASTLSPSSKRSSNTANMAANRPKGQNISSPSSLPMRPISSTPPTRSSSSSSPTVADGTFAASVARKLPPDGSHDGPKVPGRGLRPHFHPQQGPRSDHVLWCGNVPADASVEELWAFFSSLSLAEDGKERVQEGKEEEQDSAEPSPWSGHGVLSIFIISRSNCAFVNYATQDHLLRAVSHFHGQALRPADLRCPKLVCRVRKKDDEAQAGVAGQRGRGMHVAWVKEQERKAREKSRQDRTSPEQPFSPSSSAKETLLPVTAESRLPPESPNLSLQSADPLGSPVTASKDERPSISAASQDSSNGSISYTSTNSSLFRHPAFHERFFILKSLGTADLDRSVQTGFWATQPHNEQVLDQAYRNSESVYLVFSANQSGGFYGYARMAGPIFSSGEKQQLSQAAVTDSAASQSSSSRANMSRPDPIPEGDETKSEAVLAKEASKSTAIDVSQLSSSHALAPLSLLSPGDAGHGLEPTLSPQQLTPAGEVEAPTLDARYGDNQTWPTQTLREKEETAERLKRGQTMSPNALLSKPVLTPPSNPHPLESSTDHGMRRKDTDSSAMVRLGVEEEGAVLPAGLSIPSSDVENLGPSDSASGPDPRLQSHLAVRALIHNLRLEERESVLEAERLERGIGRETAFNFDSEHNSTPRASDSDSFGKTFPLEWIKTTPLSFNLVRRLRNPWRDNRQVKVSRDGTELEPNVGRQLLVEWDRADQDVATSRAASAPIPQLGEEEDEYE